MQRSFRALFLVLVLLWQSLAMAGTVSVAQRAGEIEHMAVHCQDGSDHHHHADHALHMDDADDTASQHLHADTGTSGTGLLTTAFPAESRVASMSPPQTRHAPWRSPTLDGPLRPPMQTA